MAEATRTKQAITFRIEPDAECEWCGETAATELGPVVAMDDGFFHVNACGGSSDHLDIERQFGNKPMFVVEGDHCIVTSRATAMSFVREYVDNEEGEGEMNTVDDLLADVRLYVATVLQMDE